MLLCCNIGWRFHFKKIVVPVHMTAHWCLAIIDLEKEEFKYYDSMQAENQYCLKQLR